MKKIKKQCMLIGGLLLLFVSGLFIQSSQPNEQVTTRKAALRQPTGEKVVTHSRLKAKDKKQY